MCMPCVALQAVDRRERLRRLALETIDLAKDPYYMRNHLGQIECKLCLTLHPNEGNYLAHTQVDGEFTCSGQKRRRLNVASNCNRRWIGEVELMQLRVYVLLGRHAALPTPTLATPSTSNPCFNCAHTRARGISRTWPNVQHEKRRRKLRHPHPRSAPP